MIKRFLFNHFWSGVWVSLAQWGKRSMQRGSGWSCTAIQIPPDKPTDFLFLPCIQVIIWFHGHLQAPARKSPMTLTGTWSPSKWQTWEHIPHVECRKESLGFRSENQHPQALPCLYINIYVYSLLPPEKLPRDAAEDNPSLHPVLPSFLS